VRTFEIRLVICGGPFVRAGHGRLSERGRVPSSPTSTGLAESFQNRRESDLRRTASARFTQNATVWASASNGGPG
jgi:hypothetical protein